MKKNTDLGLFILRIAVGLLMLLHGIAKLKGLDFIETLLTNNGLPAFMKYGVYITEIVAPILIIIGFRTRLAAAVFAFGALFAMLLAHAGEIFTINQYGGWGVELIGLYFLGSLALFFTGGGKWGLSSSNDWD